MELRVLKYFLVVAREENITKAASLLHVTQPTLYRQLMQLEELSGEISIGAGESNSMTALSQTMTAFRREHSLVRFSIYSATADDIKDRLEKGLLDLGLLAEPVNIQLNSQYGKHGAKSHGRGIGLLYRQPGRRAALCPMAPPLETGTVLVGKKDQTFSRAATAFLNRIKNAD